MSSRALTSSPTTLQDWKLSDAIIVGLALFAALAIGIWVAPKPQTLSPWPHSTNFQRSQLSLLVVLAIQFGAAAVVTGAICKARGIGDPLASIGWNQNRHIEVPALVGFAFVGLVSVARLVAFGGVEIFKDRFDPASIFLFFITTVLVQPFVEECYFRGILFTVLVRRIGQLGAVLLTALLFGLIHVGGYRFILDFVALGVVLGITRIKTQSVAACFALHAAYNVGVLAAGLVFVRGS